MSKKARAMSEMWYTASISRFRGSYSLWPRINPTVYKRIARACTADLTRRVSDYMG